jgi:DNA-binding NarL/FixJ family response regulator
VADEVVQGRTNKEIAVTLGITERTVKAHLGAIFAKLGVRDRLQLALRLRSRAPAGRPLPESA